ncbi:MAG: Fe-S cluster assembly protein SufD [Cycloclasticus sp. symbiont of Bathymodiolus heckerae]|nr:MAG: Fe-S cluster assembly protein SufD [Cycloclasticus sp. symbiont of Bathymodiolus heckerae]
MPVTQLSNAHYASLLEAKQSNLPGQDLDWLNRLRLQATKEFADGGFPSLRDEEWRYTNISPIEKKQFTLSDKAGDVDASFLKGILLDDCHHLVFVDGFYQAGLSSLDALPEGLVVSAISTGLAENEELIRSLFDSVVETPALGFINLNTALFTDGAVISIKEGVQVEKPIQLAFISSKDGALTVSNSRNLILAKSGSKASVIETYHGAEDTCYLTNVITEVVVEPNARLAHSRLQAESLQAYHVGGVYTRLDSNAIFKQYNYTFGATLSRCEVHAELGTASDCDLDGLFISQDQQHMDNHTRVNHAQPHAVSNEFYKGILNDKSKGVFQGRIVVAEDAQKTDAKMSNRNLLLSDRSEIDSKPQLEIYADDVKCAHGVTVGQLDDAAIFYLRSRGASEQMAKDMLTFAFANEMVERIKINPLKIKVLEELLKRLPQEGMKVEWL